MFFGGLRATGANPPYTASWPHCFGIKSATTLVKPEDDGLKSIQKYRQGAWGALSVVVLVKDLRDQFTVLKKKV